LPNNADLLYVVAEFSTKFGEKRVAKSSVFKNHLLLEGFISTDEQDVLLYAVNRSEERSDPVIVKIKPDTPPIVDVFNTLKVGSGFGGAHLKFINDAGKEYVLHTLIKGESNEWIIYDRLYTATNDVDYSVRGLPAERTDFAFYFVDEWQNSSDTLYQTLEPLYEEELNKDLWQHYPLQGEYYEPNRPAQALPLSLWGRSAVTFNLKPYDGLTLPHWITIDLGQKAIIGRMNVKPNSVQMFQSGSVKTFEIWGSNSPNPDGTWESWEFMGYFESFKPSGMPLGQKSPEDIARGNAGEEFTFSSFEQGYRYIRFKTLTTYSGSPQILIDELTLWGQP